MMKTTKYEIYRTSLLLYLISINSILQVDSDEEYSGSEASESDSDEVKEGEDDEEKDGKPSPVADEAKLKKASDRLWSLRDKVRGILSI